MTSACHAGHSLVLAIGLVVAFSASAQQKAAATAPATVAAQNASPHDAQWEYLVVSYGKTVFGNPEKTLAYRAIGLAATAQEANEIQRSLDVLGRFGWEIVTIVGAIGGDQQIVFKRRYDKTRVSNEASAILKGKEIYLKDLLDILEREKRVRDEAAAIAEAERNKPRLIELDARDAEAIRAKLSAERLAIYTAAMSGTTWGPKTQIVVRADPKFTFVDVKVDVTETMLQDGNSYRKSDVSLWLKKQVVAGLKAATSEGWGSSFITVTASLVFEGKTVVVGSEKASYSPYTRWSEQSGSY